MLCISCSCCFFAGNPLCFCCCCCCCCEQRHRICCAVLLWLRMHLLIRLIRLMFAQAFADP